MKFTDDRFKVVFYEKTGCSGNEKQKQVLSLQGISFETKSLLDTVWDNDTLKPFFVGLDKEDIVNKFAPKIKNNQLNIDTISKDELISMMCEEPILIKRPLLEIGEVKICGFDIQIINQTLQSNICEKISVSTCQSSDRCITV